MRAVANTHTDVLPLTIGRTDPLSMRIGGGPGPCRAPGSRNGPGPPPAQRPASSRSSRSFPAAYYFIILLHYYLIIYHISGRRQAGPRDPCGRGAGRAPRWSARARVPARVLSCAPRARDSARRACGLAVCVCVCALARAHTDTPQRARARARAMDRDWTEIGRRLDGD